MKISKLFHWLYASLMLLPLMVFGVTGLYYGLNQNAQLSERTEQQPVYYQSNEVNTVDDIIVGNVYKLDITTLLSENVVTNYNILTFDNLLQVVNYKQIVNLVYTNQLPYGLRGNATTYYIGYERTQDNQTKCYQFTNEYNNAYAYIVIGDITMTPNFTSQYLNYLNICDINFIKEYQPVVYDNDISTSIINSWNSTWQNPLFSWSSDSFLIAPFNYITDLFSIPQNNTFSMALSYWLAISIVYLVFDLVMYVPLLAHRWIDKGMVE